MVNSDRVPHILVDLGMTMRSSRLLFQQEYPYSLLKKKKNRREPRGLSSNLVTENKRDVYRGRFASNSRKCNRLLVT